MDFQMKTLAGLLKATAVIFACTIVGCSGDDRPKTYPVSGIVTLNGKPVDGATVTFMRADSGQYNAVSLTDANGKYQLTTFQSGDGATEGSYKVTVTKYGRDKEVSPYETGSETQTIDDGDVQSYEDAYSKAMSGGGGKRWQPPKTWNDVPDKYATTNTSGLAFDVTPQKSGHTYDIELKK
jgi:hypothetical protein